ncbi:dUTP diphosphatase [Bacillus cereus]|uniref:dUTP diphosphatase n=1 Tax=Bacillus cereus TaxID=1396 RepID=UPI003EDF5190
MNLLPFYDAQAKFDRKLEEERQLEECLRIPNKVLAFYQELGELLQEMEWVFKDWKDRDLCRDDKEKQKKEWSDAWHFAISIGNSFGHSENVTRIEAFIDMKPTAEKFQQLFFRCYNLNFYSAYEYGRMLRSLITIGHLIGMTEEEMQKAYFEKHEENYARQTDKEKGYVK